LLLASEFLKTFPMLHDVLIESWQEGMGAGNPYTTTPPSTSYGLPHSAASRVIPCANRSCNGRGFDIFQDISEMVREKLHIKEFVQVCCGDEGSPKEAQRRRDCVNTLHYRLTLKYEPEQPSS